MSVCLALEHFEPWYFQVGVGLLFLGTLAWILWTSSSRTALLRYLTSWRRGLLGDLLGCMLLCAVSAAVALTFNSVRGGSFPLIAKEPYQIYVPCPETELIAEKRTVDELILSGVLREEEGRLRFRTDVLLVDARSQQQYRQGHIEGAVNVPYGVLSGVATGDVEQLLTFQGKSRLVVYCAGWDDGPGGTGSSGAGGVLGGDLLQDDLLQDDLLQDDVVVDDVSSDAIAGDAGPASLSASQSPPSEHLADELKSRDDIHDRFFQVISVEGGIRALEDAGLNVSSVGNGGTP